MASKTHRIATVSALAVLLSCSVTPAIALSFQHVPVDGLPNVDASSIAWADFDNDGHLDFLLTGTTGTGASGPKTQLWRNTGTTFTNLPVPNLPSLYNGSAAWGDYDRDGRLDFVISGQATNIGVVVRITQLWRNTVTGFSNVTSVIAPSLPQVNESSAAWGDFNGDGRLDLYLAGFESPGIRAAGIWLNNGTTLTNATSSIAPGLQAMSSGSASVADFDNDQRPDLLLTGDAGQAKSQLWRNTPSGFVDVTATYAPGLPGVYFSSTSWGDFDRDGLVDFIITGESATGRVTQIWRNQGSSFTVFPVPGLSAARYASGVWGDFSGDGWLDFILTGDFSGDDTNQVWLNTGTTFTNVDVGLPTIWMFPKGATALADYDNDGRLDVMLTGTVPGDGRLTQIWRNTTSATNTPPPVPSGATATVSNNVVTLFWTAPSDAQSGTNLTYNLRIGTTPGGQDVLTPSAAANGFRRIPALGNVNYRRTASYTLSPGIYYWSVQAVDTSFAGGAFSPEQSFEVVADVRPTLKIQRSGTSVTVSWEPPIQGWILQQTANLNANAWTNSPSGSTNPVLLPANNTLFFRLHRP